MAGENTTVKLISRPGVGTYVVGGVLGHCPLCLSSPLMNFMSMLSRTRPLLNDGRYHTPSHFCHSPVCRTLFLTRKTNNSKV